MNNTPKTAIRFSGSKNGVIMAHRWAAGTQGCSFPYPGCGRWLRMGLEKARADVAQGRATQYVTGENAMLAHVAGF